MVRCILPTDQMMMIMFLLVDDKRDRRMIAAQIDKVNSALQVFFIDGTRIWIPLSIFTSPVIAPDFDQLELDDYGDTIRFGKYEASADWILFCASKKGWK